MGDSDESPQVNLSPQEFLDEFLPGAMDFSTPEMDKAVERMGNTFDGEQDESQRFEELVSTGRSKVYVCSVNDQEFC